MVLVTIEGQSNTETLPEAFDEIPHLEKMWGMRDDNEPPAYASVALPTPLPSGSSGETLSAYDDLADGL